MPGIRWLDIRNNAGSVEHYYHFLLGYLLPLCAYAKQRDDAATILHARSCGPMNHLVHEVAIRGLLLCEPQSHARLVRGASKLGLHTIEISGLDCGPDRQAYDADRTVREVAMATQYIEQRLGDRIEALRGELQSDSKSSPRVMVVRREDPDPYYLSEFAESIGGGTTRRSIANMDELIAALNGKFEQVRVVTLERSELAEQMALFKTVDIVVAQHGAALANAVWMRPGTYVFEFLPDPGNHFYYQDLSSLFGIKHYTLAQSDNWGSIDVETLMEVIASAIR